MTHSSEIMRLVWDNRITHVTSLKQSNIPSAMAALCPTPVTWFTLPDDMSPLVCFEYDKVPAQKNMSMADLLCEELDADIPDNAIIAFLPESAYAEGKKETSRYIGQIMTQLIMKRVYSSETALSDHTSTIMALSRVLLTVVSSGRHDIDTISYLYGVANALSVEFAGIQSEEQDEDGLFYRFDVLDNAATNAYLKLGDANYDSTMKLTFAHMASTLFQTEQRSTTPVAARRLENT